MTGWIAWSLLTSSLLAIAGGALERVAAWVGLPRRFVLIAAMIAMTVGPVAVALRVEPPGATSRANATSLSKAPSVTTVDRDGSTAVRQRAEGSRVSSLLRTDEARDAHRETAWDSDAARGSRVTHETDFWIARLWLFASGLLLLTFLRKIVTLERRRSEWYSTNTEIGPVLLSRDDGPAVVGVVRPRIVLPMWALSTEPATRAMLLRHEAEHVRAGDTRVLVAAELLLVAFPWNAALWWISNRLRLAIEIDCDARVIRAIGDARAYGSILLAVGERHAAIMPLAASLKATRLNLESRIRAMTTPRPKHPLRASWPFLGIAIIVTAVAAWTPRPMPLISARRATVPGIAFAIDTTTAVGDARSSFDTFAGRIVFAAHRGRLDIISRPQDAPVRMINGNWIAAPLASAGDYYLFDSAGFILVRPATKTFSSFVMRDLSYNYHDGRDGWPAMFDFHEVTSRGRLSATAAADKLTQHGEIPVYWHLDERAIADQTLARGRLIVADAPSSEAGVARWFAAALALASIAPSAPSNDVRLTAVIPLSPPGDRRAPTNFFAIHALSSLRATDIDLSKLVLPADFVETTWPGFEHIANAPRPSRDGGAKWRKLPGPP